MRRINLDEFHASFGKVPGAYRGALMGPNDPGVIASLCNFVRPATVLEIGVQEGHTARMLLEAFPCIQRYVGVDVPPGTALPLRVQKDEVPQDAGKEAKADSRFELLIRPHGSLELKPSDFTCRFDLVFIDGDHSALAVKQDTELARATLARHGILIWHDYENLPSVTEVINALDNGTGEPIYHVIATAICFQLQGLQMKGAM